MAGPDTAIRLHTRQNQHRAEAVADSARSAGGLPEVPPAIWPAQRLPPGFADLPSLRRRQGWTEGTGPGPGHGTWAGRRDGERRGARVDPRGQVRPPGNRPRRAGVPDGAHSVRPRGSAAGSRRGGYFPGIRGGFVCDGADYSCGRRVGYLGVEAQRLDRTVAGTAASDPRQSVRPQRWLLGSGRRLNAVTASRGAQRWPREAFRFEVSIESCRSSRQSVVTFKRSHWGAQALSWTPRKCSDC